MYQKYYKISIEAHFQFWVLLKWTANIAKLLPMLWLKFAYNICKNFASNTGKCYSFAKSKQKSIRQDRKYFWLVVTCDEKSTKHSLLKNSRRNNILPPLYKHVCRKTLKFYVLECVIPWMKIRLTIRQICFEA